MPDSYDQKIDELVKQSNVLKEIKFADIDDPHDPELWVRKVQEAKATGRLDRSIMVVKDFMKLELNDKYGNLKTVRYTDKILYAGRLAIVTAVGSGGSRTSASRGTAPFSWIALGSAGSPVPSGTQTRLGSEYAGRLMGTFVAAPAGGTSSGSYHLVRTFGAGTPHIPSTARTVAIGIREAGVANKFRGSTTSHATGSGTFLNRGTFGVITKNSSDTLRFCYDARSEVLTDSGWKRFVELEGTELVVQRDWYTGRAEYVRPSLYYRDSYAGDIYGCESNEVNFAVTPNHKMFVRLSGKQDFELLPIETLLEGRVQVELSSELSWSGRGSTLLIEGSRHSLETRSIRRTWYDGLIGCVEVPSHVILTRRDGKVMWSGNTFRLTVT